MNKAQMGKLVENYKASYDAPAQDVLWKQRSATFRGFWSEQVMAERAEAIPNEVCDRIIRILDRHGRGNTNHSEGVAGVRVPQGAWRRMLNDIHSNRTLASLIDSIFEEDDLSRRADLIDKLYDENKGNKNYLTGKSGSVISAFMAAFDPINYVSAVSLKHRRAQIEFLELAVPFDWEADSIGKRIVQSNSLLREGMRSIGIDGSARTQSWFWYFLPDKAWWEEKPVVTGTDKAVRPLAHVETKTELGRIVAAQSTLAEDIDAIMNKSVASTIKKALVDARVGQGGFRSSVLRLWNDCCCVTKSCTHDAIRASHIKPWRESTDQERLDPANGLPLAASLDALFDAGLISFEDSGLMLVSRRLPLSERTIYGVVERVLIKAPPPETAKYLSYHRAQCFLRSA